MNLFEIFEKYPYAPGLAFILLGAIVFAAKLKAINNEEFNKKLEDSPLGGVSIWIFIAGLILWGIRLLYMNSQY